MPVSVSSHFVEESYKVKEVKFIPERVFASVDRFIVIGQQENGVAILDIPLNVVSITYRNGIKPRLTLRYVVKSLWSSDDLSGESTIRKLVKATFEIPKGYKLLKGLKEKKS
ncbi:hypothetical protein J7J13_01640 [bacterium]|nr:hypothetical protein [bacterium]